MPMNMETLCSSLRIHVLVGLRHIKKSTDVLLLNSVHAVLACKRDSSTSQLPTVDILFDLQNI